MKTVVQDLIADLKAAVLIGEPESLIAALEGLRRLPDEDLPPSLLVPLGEILARLPGSHYLELLGDADAAVRGVAAAAAAVRSLAQGDIDPSALVFAAGDPVLEVRSALAQALSRSPQRAADLAESWLAGPSDPVRQSGLLVLGLLPDNPVRLIRLLEPLDAAPDEAFRATLVDTLNRLAERGAADTVLKFLESWAKRAEPNVWVITRALSASWAEAHSEKAQQILQTLAAAEGNIRPIARALKRRT